MTTQQVQNLQLAQPPAVPGLPLIGNAAQFLGSNGVPIKYIQQEVKKHGDVVQFKIMNRSIYVVSHPDLVHEILVKRVQEFQKPSASIKKPVAVARFLGKGILTADHETWRPQRKLIQPLMHTKHITEYANTMARFGEQLLDGWQDGAERDIQADMTQVTMWIIAQTMFGMNINQSSEIDRIVEVAQRIAVADFSSPLPSWLTAGREREAEETNAKLTVLVHQFMEQAESREESERYDLLSLLMNARDEDGQPMSDELIRDNILTLFFAGHETTANTLTWAFYYLSQNPDVAEKLHNEVDTVLGGRLPTIEDLPQLPYTMMVIKETMRIQPTVAVIPRRLTEDASIGGYTLKAGSLIFMSPYILQRDSRWWSNPELFDPTRFSAENEPNIQKYAYIPFGGGARICIGNHFALMEAQILLALIANRYKLHLPNGAKIEPVHQITTFPKNGLNMRLERRN